MDVFGLRASVIDNYRDYVESFLNIREEAIRDFVHKELHRGVLWPDALIQVSPSYVMGRTVSNLVGDGLIDPLCADIFQKDGKTFHLYSHQEEAIKLASREEPYVLTTGTGSGKSLAYLVPIIDHVLKNGPEQEQVRALIVYPMNALINSQSLEIQRLLDNLGAGHGGITFGQYTGQVGPAKRQYLQEHPPHILLTNYVMLELMMSRPAERVFLDRTISRLEFLVLDELHTYTGRQGADISMLVRRVRQRCGNKGLLCVGTSATMVAGGTRAEQKEKVAEVATKVFGTDVSASSIIDERLKRSVGYEGEIEAHTLARAVDGAIPSDYAECTRSTLATWIDRAFGAEEQGGHYTRQAPRTLADGALELSGITGLEEARCQTAISKMLLAGNDIRHPDGSPVFALRVHQFISQGDSVYATVESCPSRTFTLSGQRWAEGGGDGERLLVPLVFCRNCGQEYYQVTLDEAGPRIEPRLPGRLSDEEAENEVDGYLLLESDSAPVWDDERLEELPENWFRPTKSGRSLKKEYRSFIPKLLHIHSNGSYAVSYTHLTLPTN